MTKKKKVLFLLVQVIAIETIIGYINDCEDKNHINQAIYSTYYKGMTHVCFDCKEVRTMI